MKRLSIIYWSGTGNTENLANAIAEAIENQDIEVFVMPVQQATIEDVMNSDIIALGCPAYAVPSDLGVEMEELEDKHMKPFILSLRGLDLTGKRIGLFGSYDWGDRQWMRDWERQMENYGIPLIDKGLAIHRDEKNIEDKLGEFIDKLTEGSI